MSDKAVRDYLSLNPTATATEVAFQLGITVQQARLDMTDVLNDPAWAGPASKPGIDAEDAIRSLEKVTWMDVREAVIDAASGPRDAEWLADLFRSREIMDVYQAAEYLGIDRGSVEYAVTRNKLSCVQVRGKKLFTKADLDAYKAARGTGKSSRLVASAVVHEV